LISTACYSGSWTRPCWSLFSAAAKDQESVSIAESESGHFRGSFSAAALLGEHANEFGLQAPKPGGVQYIKDSNGEVISIRDPQVKHDFGVPYSGQREPIPWVPGKTTPEVLAWLHSLRKDIGRTYTSADFTFLPCQVDQIWKPLFRDMTILPTIQHNKCLPPSGVTPGGHSLSGSRVGVSTPLSKDEEEELLRLARDYLDFLPPPTLSERFLTQKCTTLLKHQDPPRKPLTNKDKVKTLNVLRERSAYRKVALGVAQKLGWDNAIKHVGDPFGMQRRMDADIPLQNKALDHDYNVRHLHLLQNNTYWTGAAGWLARVWKAAGEPRIDRKEDVQEATHTHR